MARRAGPTSPAGERLTGGEVRRHPAQQVECGRERAASDDLFQGPVQVVLDGGTLVDMLIGNVVKARDIPAAIYELAAGNPQRFLSARAAGSQVVDIPEQAQGMTQSFVCREWEPYGSPADILHAGRQEFPSFPASVLLNAPQLPFEQELCRVWTVPKGPAAQRAVRTTATRAAAAP